MIKLIEINGERYPFLFDMEVVWFLTSTGRIEIIYDKEPAEDGEKKVAGLRGEYNDMMELFLTANRSAIEYEGKGKSLTLIEIKNGIRKDPKLFIDLQKELNESEVFEVFEKLKEVEEDPEKKKKSPGTKSSG
ncbi:MAG: hypothetical protein JXL67_06195 [Calditrichaeota bacterium]|nr:hypothetical protein [Calditrichota bacterium]